MLEDIIMYGTYVMNVVNVNVIESVGTADRQWRTCPFRVELICS